MADSLIVDALRTPIGKHRGALSRVRADDLAAHVLSSVLARAPGAKEALDEVVFGATNQAGDDNRNVARMAALLAGLPYEVPGVTVNRLCGSGLEALVYASRAIRVGDADVMVAGGVESMTRAPYVMAKADEAFARTPPTVYDTSLGWRFPNPKMAERFRLDSMGETAENVAEKYAITREAQDAFAAESHRRAASAWKAERFTREIVAVELPAASKGAPPERFERDESVREDSTPAALAKLKPVFRQGGTVTAGNSSPLNDGAAALLVVSDTWAASRGVRAIARIRATAVTGVEPALMGIGPISAIRKAVDRAGISLEAVELVELNEAFAAQALACIRELGLDPAKVNVNGGAIALGHPIGCSGARVVATLVHEMGRREARYGVAALCIGVGQGIAVVVERIST